MARFLNENHFLLNISDDYAKLCENVTKRILAFSNERIAIQGYFTIVLSGGKTPCGVYQCMANGFYAPQFKWDKIHFFFGDERWVPQEDARSNYKMVSQELFTKLKIPLENIHSIRTNNCTLKNSSDVYENEIRNFFKLKKDEIPQFDLVLLGLGEDGHTASLFPGSPALAEKNSLVVGVSDKGLIEERITLSLPVINRAEMIIFVVSGSEKAMVVHKVLDNDGEKIFPANEISPDQGKLCWYIDKEAASKLVNLKYFSRTPQRIGVAADHAGFQLKEDLIKQLRESDFEPIDFGDHTLNPDDDYPDFVVPLAQAVSNGTVDRGIAICGSGVGMCIAANKVSGVRACLITEEFSAHQGVEDDDMNIICLGSVETKKDQAWRLVSLFLGAQFSAAKRHQRRLAKVSAIK